MNPWVKLLVSLILDAPEIYAELKRMAAARGEDLDALMITARAENGRTIFDVLGIAGGTQSGDDPSAHGWTTREEAIAHTVPGYPLVLVYPDGTYHVWPVIGPYPGTQVYP